MEMEFEENRGQGNVISLFVFRSRGAFKFVTGGLLHDITRNQWFLSQISQFCK